MEKGEIGAPEVRFAELPVNESGNAADGVIRWNDPEIGVEWGIDKPILSAKDEKNPFLSELGKVF